MKRFELGVLLGLCLAMVPGWALALTYTTPTTTDGVVESSTPALGGTTWESDELMANDGGTNFYVTWDDTMLFVAITGTYATQEDGQYDWFIAFDIDHVPGSGGTADGYGHVTFSGDYLPEYIYYRAGGFGWYESSDWTGSSWNYRGWSSNCSYGGWSGNLVSEMCIPLSMLGNADSLAIVSWISTEDNSQIVASFPTANPIGAKSQPMNYFWVAPTLGAGVAPNTLAVKPTPPSAIVDNERSFAVTCTVMADITPGNCGGAVTSMTFYYTTDGTTPTLSSPFVVGAYDTCRTGADTTDTFYGVIPAPDDSTVKWIAVGTASNGLSDTSDNVQSFVQGGTAWVGNAGSSPTDCTVWAEIFVGDDGATTWMKFKYTTDLSDPRASGTAVIADGTFDYKTGNNDRYYAVLSGPSNGDTVTWYAYGLDKYNNTAQTDTFFTFIQGDTARIYN
ncbi:MAG: chitobiase/beta-hexosaminidase C-terminal domain-containing protein, partial [bacterium]